MRSWGRFWYVFGCFASVLGTGIGCCGDGGSGKMGGVGCEHD